MRFETVVDKRFGHALAQLDARNARNMVSAVRACLQGRRLVMTELARHWPNAIKVAAPLKRLDRLLGNRRVYAMRRANRGQSTVKPVGIVKQGAIAFLRRLE